MGDAPPPKPPKPTSVKLQSIRTLTKAEEEAAAAKVAAEALAKAKEAPRERPKSLLSALFGVATSSPTHSPRGDDDGARRESRRSLGRSASPAGGRPQARAEQNGGTDSGRASPSEGPKEVRSAGGPDGSPAVRFITVPLAREEKSADGADSFMMYNIIINLGGGNSKTVKKRFSEFASFHKEWKGLYPNVNIAMPQKLLSVNDEDVAMRCYELQTYLHECLEVTALVYHVAKFLGVDEATLKTALKGGRSKPSADAAPPPPPPPDSAQSGIGNNAGRGTSSRTLPKVTLDNSPKALPKVSLAQALSGPDNDSPSRPSTPPKPQPTPIAKAALAAAAAPPPTKPVKPTAAPEPLPPAAAVVPVSKPAPEPAKPPQAKPPQAKPPQAKPVATPVKAEPAKSSASAGGSKPAAAEMNGAPSLKERMAAFQKKS